MNVLSRYTVQLSAILLTTALGAGAANAATYVSTSSVGDGSVRVSITTDDTIGALVQSNIIDWNIDIMDGIGNTFTLTGPLSGNNSSVGSSITGSTLSATPTDLLFDFGDGTTDDGSYLLFQGAGGQLYCLQRNRCFDFGGPAEGFNLGTNGLQRSSRLGVTRIGSVVDVSAAVPEPGTWAMMLLGFGAIGFGMRRRKQEAISVGYSF